MFGRETSRPSKKEIKVQWGLSEESKLYEVISYIHNIFLYFFNTIFHFSSRRRKQIRSKKQQKLSPFIWMPRKAVNARSRGGTSQVFRAFLDSVVSGFF